MSKGLGIFQLQHNEIENTYMPPPHTHTNKYLPTFPNEGAEVAEKKGGPTVIGAVPVLVPDGRAVRMGRSGHQSLFWDQASSALVVIIHH